MKKLFVLLLAMLMAFSAVACGDKDPNLGKYLCVSSSMTGTENDWVELEKGGKGTFCSAFEFDLKWELDGETFTGAVTFLGMEEALNGTLKDGILTVSYGSIDYVFAKEGVEVSDSGNGDAPDVSEPESGKSDNGGAVVPEAESGAFFSAPSDWNGWIMIDDDMLDATAVLGMDSGSGRMFFDVYLDNDSEYAYYSAYVENLEDRTLLPVIGSEDAWIDDLYMVSGDEYTYAFYRNYDDGIVSTATYPGTDNDGYEMMMYFKKVDAAWNPDSELLPPDQSDIRLIGQESEDPETTVDDPVEDPANAPAVSGDMYHTGNFGAIVPDGWMAFPVEDLFADQEGTLDPDALKICKGGETEWDLYTKPYVQITYYGKNAELWPPTKDWYDDAVDIESFTAGNFTWQGFTATSFDMPMTILWGINGEDEYQITIWTQQSDDGEVISHTDADVLAILASLTIGG